uniref:ZP domain-containing protein n=1 Tax=Ciona savignyi TaxID=51511 RepID=H2Z5V8_CIOSA
MKMSWGLLILCLVAFCVEEQESINVVNKLGFPPPNCTLADNVTREVYRGWTFKVDCELLEAEVEDYDDFTCAIMDMDRKSVLRNNTAYFDEALFTAYENYDARDDSPLNFFVQATVPGIPFCAYAEVHINLTNAPQHTCQESFTVWVNSTINVGEPLDLSCTAPALQPSVLSPIPSNMTGTWLKNCSSFSSNSTVILPGNAAVVNKLRFPSFSYDDVWGLYLSCVVQQSCSICDPFLNLCETTKFPYHGTKHTVHTQCTGSGQGRGYQVRMSFGPWCRTTEYFHPNYCSMDTEQ